MTARCPSGHPLPGLAKFCHPCGAYVEDLERGAQPCDEGQRAPATDSRPEAEIEAGIIQALRLLGFGVWKLSQPRQTMQSEGVADLYVTGPGVAIWAEIKRPSGKQSEAQRRFQAAVELAGESYVVWRSETEAMEWAQRWTGRDA